MARAEPALTEAFRLRRIGRHPELAFSYFWMSRLRLAKNDAAGALRLADAALEEFASRRSTIYSWYLLRGKAGALAALGRLDEAFEQLGQAVREIGKSRLHLLPADSLRVGSSSVIDEIYSEYVDTGCRLYLQKPSEPLLVRIVEGALESRGRSLRHGSEFAARFRRAMPAEYVEELSRLQAAYADSFTQNTVRTLQESRLRLTELESRAMGSPRPAEISEGESPRLDSLKESDALFLFHLGEPNSYLFAATRKGWKIHSLPARSRIEGEVKRLVRLLREGSPEFAAHSAKVYRDVFGPAVETARVRSASVGGGICAVTSVMAVSVSTPLRPRSLATGRVRRGRKRCF